MVNVTATGVVPVTITLPDGASDVQHSVTVKWKANNTQDVHVQRGGSDTIDFSTGYITLNTGTPIWTGVAGQ